MVRSQISIRLEKETKAKLITLAKYHNKTYAELIRDQINLLILNGVNYEVKQRVKSIVKELKGPFAYVKSPKGLAWAQREREIRATISKKIETVFNL